ncbi:NRDE family protein [Litoribacillus peritrichatus]|uniref:NRDE family protein n=1 Tax=Litoribacillus peritrichatus TaxID=718191 RepID=A0ABP7MEQ3_9GAMM
MCTLSWLNNDDGYEIFFNRDEQRSRAKAIPPKLLNLQDVSVLMPVDPRGNGSWISVNEFGLSLCLLNFYQGHNPRQNLKSRGQLLKTLSHFEDTKSVVLHLTSMDLTCYAPFTLVAITDKQEFSVKNTAASHQTFQWDGQHLQLVNLKRAMITSSSVMFDTVAPFRIDNFDALSSSASAEDHSRFHQGHTTKEGYKSVCMHREDAKTVSFSRIHVSDKEIKFSYLDGSPCQGGDYITTYLPRCVEGSVDQSLPSPS